jgi:site-specific recombinase XerD
MDIQTQIQPYQSHDITRTFAIEDGIREWLANLDLRVSAGEISQDTSNTYRRGVSKFLAWLDGREPNGDAILEWMAYLRSLTNKPAAINAWLGGVRSFFGWATTKAHIPFNPTQGIRGAKRSGTKKRHIREALTDAEVIRLLKQPDRNTVEGKRDYALLVIQLFTASRGIELHRADVADLQTQSGRLILMVQGKGQTEKDEPLILVSEAAEAVRDWLSVHPSPSGALFVSLSDRSNGERLSRSATREIIKRYFKLAGVVGNKTSHSLRHTAITNAIRHDVPITRVSKQLARHSSIDTTMIYVHETDRMNDPVEEHIFYGGNGEQ